VFQAEDPGGAVVQRSPVEADDAGEFQENGCSIKSDEAPIKPDDAGIRIDLTRIGGQK